MLNAGTQSTAPRLASIDVYRGLVMLLLLAEVLRLCVIADALPGSVVWQFLCYHQSHAEWTGTHLHDLIQPGFTFLVGVSMPLSIARRLARGDSHTQLLAHAARRALVLVVLGIAMLSIHPRTILWKFDDTLSQIGLGYFFVFAMALGKPRLWGIALAAILLGYWLAFAAYPVAEPDFDYASVVGADPQWVAVRQRDIADLDVFLQRRREILAVGKPA